MLVQLGMFVGGNHRVITQPQRTRRIRRWRDVACLTNIFVLLMFLLSLRWNFGVGVVANGANQPGAYLVGVENGAIMLSRSFVTQLPSVVHAGGQRRMEAVMWKPSYVGSWVGRFLHIPFWLVGAPLVAWGAWVWRRRPFESGCPACGYDVAGLTGQVCPECGGKVLLSRK